MAFRNPSLGDDAYYLRFAEREAREGARVSPKSAVLVKEQAATSGTVSLSLNYEIRHFTVHTELDELDRLSSALLPAREGTDDGRLEV